MYAPIGGPFGYIRYNVKRRALRGMLTVVAHHYAEADDPKRRFSSCSTGYVWWVNPSSEPEVEYALKVLRASHDRAVRVREGDGHGGPQQVFVRFWQDRPGIGPHGVVHTNCYFSRRRRSGEWGRAENAEAADRDFPDYELFWCTKCFGADNPRRFHRDGFHL